MVCNPAAVKEELKKLFTTLMKPDGNQTNYTGGTLRHILEHFSPEDNNNDDDDDDNRRPRLQSQPHTSTAHEEELNTIEIRGAIGSLGGKILR